MRKTSKYGRVKNVTLSIRPNHEGDVEGLLKSYFSDSPHFQDRGGPFHPKNYQEFLEHFAGAVGAPHGSTIELSVKTKQPSTQGSFSKVLAADIRHPEYKFKSHVEFGQNRDGQVYMQVSYPKKESELINNYHRMIVGSINSLRKLGVSRIEANASGSFDTFYPQYDFERRDIFLDRGYFFYPMMGFRGRIPNDVWRKIPKDVRKIIGHKREVSRLLDFPGGATFWRRFGKGVKATFSIQNPDDIARLLDSFKKHRLRDLLYRKRPYLTKHDSYSDKNIRRLSRVLHRYQYDPIYTRLMREGVGY